MNSVHEIESYDITGKGFAPRVEQMVRACHMNYLAFIDWIISDKYGFNIYISQKSSWRPKWWERKKGRSGSSSHTYSFMGATDVTCDDFSANWEVLLEHLIKNTSYTRIAVYKSFIHVDYKNEWSDSYVYKVVNGKWVRDYPIDRIS